MNRRTFLTTATATAGLLLSPACNPGAPRQRSKNWTWIRAAVEPLDQWPPVFARLRAAGIDAVLLDRGPDDLRRITPLALDAGLEVHAWMYTMMQGGHEADHPEWYAVNRSGRSTATDPPYVGYYKFMCPSREPVRAHLRRQVEERASIPGLSSVHLDYIRYPDVILPIALQPTYDLVQDREYPDFDYCYCDVCRVAFQAQTGRDPLDLEDPAVDAAWVQYRYDTITAVVAELAPVAHAQGAQITAAVFPTPDLAKKLVRQDWTRWDLDAVLPMLYHNFYNEDLAWIEAGTRDGVNALAGRMPLYSGLYIPALDPAALAQAATHALQGGAGGVAIFEGMAPTDQHWARLREVLT